MQTLQERCEALGLRLDEYQMLWDLGEDVVSGTDHEILMFVKGVAFAQHNLTRTIVREIRCMEKLHEKYLSDAVTLRYAPHEVERRNKQYKERIKMLWILVRVLDGALGY